MTLAKDLFDIVSSGGNPQGIFNSLQRILEKVPDNEVRNILKVEMNGSTIFGHACKNNLVQVAEYLQNKVNVSVETPTPFWLAVSRGNVSIVKLLCRIGVDFKKPAPDGTTPLVMALSRGNKEIISCLYQLYDSEDNAFETLKCCLKFGKHERLRDEFSTLVFNGDQLQSLLSDALISEKVPGIDFVFGRMGRRRELSEENATIIRSRFSRQMRAKFTDVVTDVYNPLVDLTKKFPSFNPDVESKWSKGWSFKQDARRFDKCVNLATDIGHKAWKICSLDADDKVSTVSEISFAKCRRSCKRKTNCQLVRDLIGTVQKLETELRDPEFGSREDRETTKFLRPTFHLIGSIPEGTRLGEATEIDVSVTFDGLKDNPFQTGAVATELLMPSGPIATKYLLKFRNATGRLDYPKLLSFLAEAFASALQRIALPKGIRVARHNNLYEPCQTCREIAHDKSKSIHYPIFHCEGCTPVVTTTKIGLCLAFTHLKNFVTVDIVPMYHVDRKDTFKLFQFVTKTLVEHTPPFWLDYLDSVLKRDAILPEAISENRQGQNPQLVSIKLLHHGPEPNFMIRPGQEIEIENFDEIPLLKKVYIHVKGLKDILKADTNSFNIKKVLLRPEFVESSADPNMKFDLLLLKAMSHPYLKVFFEQQIDYETWEKCVGYKRNSKKNLGLVPLRGSFQLFE